jgi:hypothetical protein
MMEEPKLRLLKNRMLRRVFGPGRYDVTGGVERTI